MFREKIVYSEKKKNGTRTTGGAILGTEAALESAAAQQKQKLVYVAAVATGARHIGPEQGQCRCACVSSINLLKMGIRVQQHAAAKTIPYSNITKPSNASQIKKCRTPSSGCLLNHTMPHLSRRTLQTYSKTRTTKVVLSFMRAHDPAEHA